MTRKSIYEYAAAVRQRYLTASKGQKALILNEFCEASGYHRKSAIRLLGHPPAGTSSGRRRPHQYGLDVLVALKSIWEAADRICSTAKTIGSVQPTRPNSSLCWANAVRHLDLNLQRERRDICCRSESGTRVVALAAPRGSARLEPLQDIIPAG